MKTLSITTAALLAAGSAFALKPAVERESDNIAANGCGKRDGDFIVRGMVSNPNENTSVLSDPADGRSTLSISF